MNRCRWTTIVWLGTLVAVVPAAHAQQPGPRVGYVFPAGGRQGTAFQVTLGGQRLQGVTKAFVSGEGVEVKVLEYLRASPQGQFNTLREKLKRLEQKKQKAPKESEKQGEPEKKIRASDRWTDADEKTVAELRKKLAMALHGPPVPAIGETVTLQVTVAAEAEPGPREIRLETPQGLTNPLAFCIGKLPEFFSTPAELTEEVLGKGFRYRDEPRATPPAPPADVTLPAVLNGQIMPGGVDRYRFTAQKGQRLVIAASARQLIPYISDAVPGWFQAELTLRDAGGRELAYADHYQFHPDPVLFYEVPKDGAYFVEIHDSIYRGRDDFVYRITLGEVPFVTGIFPLGGQAGTQTTVELAGWNLPATRLTLDNKDLAPGIYPLAVQTEQHDGSAVPFAVDALPESVEKEPNDTPDNAQPVVLPVIVNGRIDHPDDRDVFRFEGRAGSPIVAEVYARRLDSPLDSVLKLTDASGRPLAINDDHEDKGAGLQTHHADSYLRATLPTDGTYYLYLRDAQHQGGPEYAYRLRISLPRPDFELRVVPSSITIRGASIPLTVYALRRDGFAGAIALALKGDPEGLTLSSAVAPPPAAAAPDGHPVSSAPAPAAIGTVVPAGQDQVQLTLKVARNAPQEGTMRLDVEGRATIQDREVVHLAVPAEDMMQAFEYRHLVPSRELKVVMLGRTAPKVTVKVLSKTPVKIPAGGSVRVRIGASSRSFFSKVNLGLRKPPAGISVEATSPSREGVEIVLQSDAAKVKPGLKGTLYLTAVADKPGESGKGKTQATPPRMPSAAWPSIPFEVVTP